MGYQKKQNINFTFINNFQDEIKRVTQKLKQAETRSEFAERSVQKLQKEVINNEL